MSYIYNLTDTWNAAGTTFAGIKMAVTNTASGASSMLLDLSVSGATTGSFSVDKSGNASLSGGLTLGTALSVANGGSGLTSLTAGRIPFGAGTSAFGNSANLFWDSGNTRLGVGTAIPAAVLHATLASTASLLIGFNNTSANYYDANTHYFRSGSSGAIGNIDVNGQLNFVSANIYKSASPNSAGFITAFGGASTNYYDANLQIFRDGGTLGEVLRISSGNLLIGTSTAGASKLVVNDSSIQINTAKTPASATATGTTGQVCWDSGYIYVCTASNTWRRAAIASW